MKSPVLPRVFRDEHRLTLLRSLVGFPSWMTGSSDPVSGPSLLVCDCCGQKGGISVVDGWIPLCGPCDLATSTRRQK
jgi:hypothetical protein